MYMPHRSYFAAINTIYFGVLLLTICTRHFPISYEGVLGLKIGVDKWIAGVINQILNVVTGQSDKICMVLSPPQLDFHQCDLVSAQLLKLLTNRLQMFIVWINMNHSSHFFFNKNPVFIFIGFTTVLVTSATCNHKCRSRFRKCLQTGQKWGKSHTNHWQISLQN